MAARSIVLKPSARRGKKSPRARTKFGQINHARTVFGAASLLSALVALGGCGGGNGVEIASTWRSVPAVDAFVLPPPGGPGIVGVMERRYSNATQQDISLATTSRVSGQNLLQVQFFGPVNERVAGSTSIYDKPLAATDISREMRAKFPGVAMVRSEIYVQNRYGAFGYAVGRAGTTDLCIYAWQRIKAVASQTTLISNRGTIQLRLRLCHSGASEQQLLAFMYGFSISGTFSNLNWNPYGAPLSPSETLGRTGAPVFPVVPAPVEEAVDMPVPGSSAPIAKRRPARRIVEPAPEPLPGPVGPIVPPPPTGGTESTAIVPMPPCIKQPGKPDESCN